MINSAKAQTEGTFNDLMGADSNAGEARRIAQEAQRIAEKSSSDADGIRSEAEQTKARAQNFKDIADKQAVEVEDAADRLRQLNNQADQDKTIAQTVRDDDYKIFCKSLLTCLKNRLQALEKANEAKANAKDADEKVNKALGTVNDILKTLGMMFN